MTYLLYGPFTAPAGDGVIIPWAFNISAKISHAAYGESKAVPTVLAFRPTIIVAIVTANIDSKMYIASFGFFSHLKTGIHAKLSTSCIKKSINAPIAYLRLPDTCTCAEYKASETAIIVYIIGHTTVKVTFGG
jgi:hypothetical protein